MAAFGCKEITACIFMYPEIGCNLQNLISLFLFIAALRLTANVLLRLTASMLALNL